MKEYDEQVNSALTHTPGRLVFSLHDQSLDSVDQDPR